MSGESETLGRSDRAVAGTTVSETLTTATGRVTLERVVHDLGSTLLTLVCGTAGQREVSGGVVFHDPLDGPLLPPGCIVLGVNVQERGDVEKLIQSAGRADAAAVVLRSPVILAEDAAGAVAESGLAVLGLATGASWHQLSTLLGSLLHPRGDPDLVPPSLGGVPTGDLFGLANAICALIDAPITIEDRSSKVLAFSDRQDEADFIRIECILGRRTPDQYAAVGEASGAHRAIRRATRPLFIEPIAIDDVRPVRGRVVVPVRAGDELLGTVWGVVDEPLSPERDQLFLEASRLVALHMLHQRTGADVAQRLISDLVTTALGGGPDAPVAMGQLGVDQAPCLVVALAPRAPGGGQIPDPASLAGRALALERLASAFELHLTVTRPGSRVAVEHGVVYAIVPAPREQDAEMNIRKSCVAFTHRLAGDQNLVVGIGRITPSGDGLTTSRRDAERALRVLRSTSGLTTSAVCASDVEMEALLLDLQDLITTHERRPSGAYARLLAYDSARNGFLIDTLQAWLDAHGDVTVAAEQIHVHQNTFRYRLRRIAEIGEVDLADPRERLGLQLQLEVFPAADWLGDGETRTRPTP